MEKQRIKFYVEKDSFWVEGSVILMILAILFRIIGCWGFWLDWNQAILQVGLPVVGGLLFILLVLLLGKHALWTTALPVLMGVAFFIIKAFDFDNTLQTVLCVLLYVLIAILYVGTVFTLIRTKWLLVPLFALPFLYHIFVEDLKALQDTANPVTFSAGMQEMSVLCIMLSLLLLSLGMKKLVKEPRAPKAGKTSATSANGVEVAVPAADAPAPAPAEEAAPAESADEVPPAAAEPAFTETEVPAAEDEPVITEAESAPQETEQEETDGQK